MNQSRGCCAFEQVVRPALTWWASSVQCPVSSSSSGRHNGATDNTCLAEYTIAAASSDGENCEVKGQEGGRDGDDMRLKLPRKMFAADSVY